MAELGWREAVIKVLDDSNEELHYTRIAELVAEKKLRKTFGANPATSVNVAISYSLKSEGDKSPFVRVSLGTYALKSFQKNEAKAPVIDDTPTLREAGLINAFGMYWSRNAVFWKKPKLLGQQQQDSNPVDFAFQTGVYLLYDGREVIYVGRAVEQSLGIRLQAHTVDRLNGRWDRFSWFGIYAVTESGALDLTNVDQTFGVSMLIATMEALLIEGLEPPQTVRVETDFLKDAEAAPDFPRGRTPLICEVTERLNSFK